MLTIAGMTVIADVPNAFYGEDDVPETVEHPDTGETVAHIGWHRTDAWRGYYEATAADGWTKIGDGCSCGSWGDAPSGTSDDEVEAQLRALAEEHGDIVVVLGGSSNLFSMPFDVFARAEA